MSPDKPVRRRFPKVPIDRRAYAFGIDFIIVWFITTLAKGNWFFEFIVFCLIWYVSRVIVVYCNRGQSLGRWAFDMKVMDAEFNKIPSLIDLAKREAIVGVGAFLAIAGIQISIYNLISMILFLAPLIADCTSAIPDDEFYRTFHDRVANTLMIQTRRGFSLDLRIKAIWREIQSYLRNRNR